MKKAAILTVLCLTAILATGISSSASDNEIVIVINTDEALCPFMQADGTIVLIPATRVVVNPGAGAQTSCDADGVENDTGHAIVYTSNDNPAGGPVFCWAGDRQTGHFTDKWHQRITPNGKLRVHCGS